MNEHPQMAFRGHFNGIFSAAGTYKHLQFPALFRKVVEQDLNILKDSAEPCKLGPERVNMIGMAQASRINSYHFRLSPSTVVVSESQSSTLKHFASGTIRLMSPPSTLPGPASTKTVTLEAAIVFTQSSQSTG